MTEDLLVKGYRERAARASGRRARPDVRPSLAPTEHRPEEGWAAWYALHTFVVRPDHLGGIEASPDFE